MESYYTMPRMYSRELKVKRLNCCYALGEGELARTEERS